MTEITYLLIGALLTLLSSWVIEGQKNKIIKKEKGNNFKLVVKQELISISKGIDKLKIIFENRNWFDLMTINQIEKDINNLESQRKNAIYLYSIKLQESFIEIFSKMTTFIISVRLLEDNYLKKLNEIEKKKRDEKNFNEQQNLKELDNSHNPLRTIKMIELAEIQRKIEDFIKNLD
jgi:ribosomal protein S8